MNKTKLLSLLVLLGAYFLLSSACCNRKDTVKYLTEGEKSWLPYQVGDTLFYYEGDTLVATSVVNDVTVEEGGANKYFDKCSKETSEIKKVSFPRHPIDSLKIPYRITVGYDTDTLFFVVGNSGGLNSDKVSSMEIDGIGYKDVTVITELYTDKVFQYVAKPSYGLLQIEYGNKRTYSVKRKRK
tara:strand:+ start:936 stop:1487 length:552 start_codon:yes stop_codon:yes gene_type:complete